MCEEIFVCEYCGKQCANISGLHFHENRCISNPNKIIANTSNIIAANKARSKGDWECCLCHNKFNTRNEMTIHKQHCRDNLRCIYCYKEFKNTNSLANHERRCRLNPSVGDNLPNSPFVKYNQQIRDGKIIPWNKGKTKETCDSILRSVITRKENLESGKISLYWNGKHHSDETKEKLSKAQTEYLISSGINRWSNAHSSKRSFAENYFYSILNSICEEQYVIAGLPYRIDFANLKNKIAIEIDGEQHYNLDSLSERDCIRDKRLLDHGWRTIRIRWSHFQRLSDNEKHNFISNLLLELE